MEQLTFNELPKAVTDLQITVNNIERLLLAKSNEANPQADQLLTIKQAAEFLNLSVPTLYGKVHNAEIPVCKKSKRLYFSKHDLTEWIKSGRKKTFAEMKVEAETNFNSKIKGRHNG